MEALVYRALVYACLEPLIFSPVRHEAPLGEYSR